MLQFMRLLWAIDHGLERVSKRMTSQLGVTGPQRLVLRVVSLSPGLSAGQLAAILHLHPSTLTGILRRLVNEGLLARHEHRNDRRRAVLRVTRSGRNIAAPQEATVESVIAAVLRETPSRDREATRRVLERTAIALRTAAVEQSTRPNRARRRASR